MNEKQIKELFDRLGRLVNATAQKTGDTFAWQCTFEVVIQVAEPNLVQFNQPVLDHSDEPIGDVFDYIKNGIATLEKIRDEIECIE